MAIIKLGFDFSCDHRDCTTTARFIGNINAASDAARGKGWAVSRDRKSCYCPQHASWHRNIGGWHTVS